MITERKQSGILLHITSLPNKQGIGTLGNEAYDFIDKLTRAGQKIWQILPLGPTGYGDSPYQTFSAFAGNPLLLDMNDLVKRELLQISDLENLKNLPEEKVDFGSLFIEKNKLLKLAFVKFQRAVIYDVFCSENEFWLHDYAFFMAIKDHFNGKSWHKWPKEIKLRNPFTLNKLKSKLINEIEYHKFLQFLFWQQWQKLHFYAKQNDIKIFGDIPIFVAFDSADAWSNQDLFQFDKAGNPTAVAGVPPDYFSATGQLWGNPLYNWHKMKENNFIWWMQRFRHSIKMYNLIRVDHFRGFCQYWAVPFGEKTAVNGSWQPALGEELFSTLKMDFDSIPIVAEDLGVITDDVIALKEKFGFPGMNILQFAFDGSETNPYLPSNYEENCIAYTGTHDNDTTRGWFQKLSTKEQTQICQTLKCRQSEICFAMINAILASKGDITIIPLQDWLELGSEARMNTPGTDVGNWQWRLLKNQFNIEVVKKIKETTKVFGR